mgnify:CR=1 FL=1
MVGSLDPQLVEQGLQAVLQAADKLDQDVEYIRHENGFVATNGKLGGWTKTKDGSFVSIEYAKSLNRAQRRKEGIKL